MEHPSEWAHGGYREIQHRPPRYALIDVKSLMVLLGIDAHERLLNGHRQWVSEALKANTCSREAHWTESLAVGSRSFVARVKERCECRGTRRKIAMVGSDHTVREPESAYRVENRGENAGLREK